MRILKIILLTAGLATSFCTFESSEIIKPGNKNITIRPYQVNADPAIFETCFFSNAVSRQGNVIIPIRSDFLGNIPVSSGRIIVTDPVTLNKTAFTTEFPHGRFPVELAVAQLNGDRRVAFARIVFSDEPVSRWELALIPGQKPISIHDSTFYGYSVDAGTALFIDADHIKSLSNQLNNQDVYDNLFIKSFELITDKSYRTGFLYAAQSDTLATFETGWGDGFYGTYIGFDSKNKPCRLLTDFQVLPWK